MVDRIQNSNSSELIQELLRAEKEAEADAARKVQLEAARDVQALEGAESVDDVAIDQDISAKASEQQDRGEAWSNFQASARADEANTDASANKDDENAEKLNVQDLLNQMAIQSGKISS